MSAPFGHEAENPYLSSPARLLYDTCREAGRDDRGKACPTCPVRRLCDDELQRAGRNRESGGALDA